MHDPVDIVEIIETIENCFRYLAKNIYTDGSKIFRYSIKRAMGLSAQCAEARFQDLPAIHILHAHDYISRIV